MARTLFFVSVAPTVWCRVVEKRIFVSKELEVESVRGFQVPELRRRYRGEKVPDVVDSFRAFLPDRRRISGESDAVADPGEIQRCSRVRVQRLVFADEVVVEMAGMTKLVVLTPVFVQTFHVSSWIQDVSDEFAESDVVAVDKRLRLRFRSVAPNDLPTEFLLKINGIPFAELVFVRGQQSLEGMAHEHEFEVGFYPVENFGVSELIKRLESRFGMRIGGLNVERVLLLASSSSQNQHDALPIGACDLGREQIDRTAEIFPCSVSKF